MTITEIAITACGAGLVLNAGLTCLLLSWFRRGEDAATGFLESDAEVIAHINAISPVMEYVPDEGPLGGNDRFDTLDQEGLS